MIYIFIIEEKFANETIDSTIINTTNTTNTSLDNNNTIIGDNNETSIETSEAKSKLQFI